MATIYPTPGFNSPGIYIKCGLKLKNYPATPSVNNQLQGEAPL